jgi:hypothetical protein
MPQVEWAIFTGKLDSGPKGRWRGYRTLSLSLAFLESLEGVMSKTNLILGVFLVRQYNSAPLIVGQLGEGA